MRGFIVGARATGGQRRLGGTLEDGGDAVSDKLHDVVGFGGKCVDEKGTDTGDYLDDANTERNEGERPEADAPSAAKVDGGFGNK